MIITIKQSPNLDVDDAKKIRAIENILISHGECRHAVWMPVDIVQELLSANRFSEYAQRILYDLRSSVVETRGIEKNFSFHVEVDFSNAKTLQPSNNKTLIGYSHLVNATTLNKSVFLAENLRDAEIFSLGAESYLFHNQLYRSYGISLERAPGGGNTTFDYFSKLEEESKFFFCIIDSDLKHPKGPIGSTAKRFSETPSGYHEKRFLRILDCHEIENIIPLQVVRAVTNGEIEKGLTYRLNRCKEDRKHPDHKSGLSIDQAIDQDDKYNSDHWKLYYPHKAKKGQTWIIPPLGENLLSHCLKLMSEISIEKLTEYISTEFDETWIDISKDVASWGVAAKRPIH
ncbi:hypothetical protein [Pseudomonas sp. PSE14]|uniref:hypothetical protein n=1 Tax=Pseudomonas sp. PSE14 TaxID=3016341 RepID=UPI0023D7CF43|nr:hypothetical protein [Pseudomonas sp. PSE14]WEJ74573.1 hypothetical protein O6P39_12095 [Pseudomonas sp. PSE14]